MRAKLCERWVGRDGEWALSPFSVGTPPPHNTLLRGMETSCHRSLLSRASGASRQGALPVLLLPLLAPRSGPGSGAPGWGSTEAEHIPMLLRAKNGSVGSHQRESGSG